MNEEDRRRLARIESRIVQVMIRLEMDPYARYIDKPDIKFDTQSYDNKPRKAGLWAKTLNRLRRINPNP
jgi:hypothetical protein